jgi:hypothetical protein
VLEKLGADELLKEIELREAAYLRFQGELADPLLLDEAVTWVEVQEGSPELAFAGGVVCSGDMPDELRRVGATKEILLELAAADERAERSEVLTLPAEERRKKLKELAPYYLRAKLQH